MKINVYICVYACTCVGCLRQQLPLGVNWGNSWLSLPFDYTGDDIICFCVLSVELGILGGALLTRELLWD
jgi:hypothetical protein